LEEYSNEAHLSAVMAAIQYSETPHDTNLQNQDDSPPDFEGEDDDSYSLLWNHTNAPIILKDFLIAFLRALPPLSNSPLGIRNVKQPSTLFCPCSILS
jgi:hypothetical protein